MKKTILIITILFLVTGCYDYKEINNLAIVSAIGIDYESNKYNLTLEILNDTKKDNNEENNNSDSYTVKASGKTITKAFDNVTSKITKIPYYYHIKAIVINETVAKDHIFEVTDYILRNTEIRNEFYFLIAKDVSANKILNTKGEYHNVIGDNIAKLIENNQNINNISYNKSFEDFLERVQNKKIDALATIITLEKDAITIKGIGIFKNFKYKTMLNKNNSALINLLSENNNSSTLTKYYNDKSFSIKIYSSDVKYKIKDKDIKINVDCEGIILENNPDFNLRKSQTYIKLNKDFSSMLNKDLNEVTKYLQEKNLDPLGFNNKYYQKTRKKVKNINEFNIKIKANVNINKKGLIFGDKHE